MANGTMSSGRITKDAPEYELLPLFTQPKLDVGEFYDAVFPALAPYVKDRVLALERRPDGIRGECFFQKEKPKGMPPGTPAKRIAHAIGGKSTNYVVGSSLTTQLALVNLGCVAVHVMSGRAKSPRCT